MPFARAEVKDQSPIPVSLTFTAPKDCARPDDFKARVAIRSKRILFVEAGEKVTRIVASVTPGSGEVRVRLNLSNVDGTSLTREFSAPNCTEGVDAIALVTAITLDRFAKAEPETVEQPPTESDTTSATGNEPEEEEGDRADTKAEGEPEPAPDLEPASTEPPEVDTAPQFTQGEPAAWHVIASGAIEGLSGVVPVSVAGVSAGAGVWWDGDVFAPMVKLVGSHYPGVTYPANGGDATFRVDAARLLLCPIRLGVKSYGLRPCLAGLGGRILASGSRTLERQSHSVPLWSGGGALLAVVRPTATILLTGELALLGPMQRDAFRFAPDPEFHRVSKLIVSGGLGFGLEFP